MGRFAPIAVGGIIVVICAVVQGYYSERWVKHEATATQMLFAKRMQNIPLSFGDWDSKEGKADPRQIKQAHAVGHFERVYTSRRNSDQEVTVFLICGNPRHITDHSPDQCYVCQGYVMPEEAHRYLVPLAKAPEAEFYNARFRKEALGGSQQLRVFWAWNTEKNHWQAPTVPRISLDGHDALYKLYVISEKGVEGSPADSPNVAFLREFIPELDKALYSDATDGVDKSADEKAIAAPPTNPPTPQFAQSSKAN